MQLDKKYLGRINFPKGTKKISKYGDDAYAFPCPICSTRKTTTGKLKPNNKTASLTPSYTNNCYTYRCFRCKTKGNLLNYLLMYQPYLAEEYKREKQQISSNKKKQLIHMGFTPDFVNRKCIKGGTLDSSKTLY